MDRVIVRRNGAQVVFNVSEFWSLCANKQLLRTDEIFDWRGGRLLAAVLKAIFRVFVCKSFHALSRSLNLRIWTTPDVDNA